MHIRLNHILFLGFTLISMVPVIFLAWWMQRSALDKEIEAVEEKHLLVARNLTGALSRYVSDVEAGFQLAAEMLGPDHQGASIESLLKGLYIKHVFLANGSGLILGTEAMKMTAMPDRIPKQILSQLAPNFEQSRARPGKIIYSDLMRGFEGDPALFLVNNIGPDQFIVGTLGTEYLIEVQRSVTFGKRGHAAIVDRQGRTIAHPVADWRKTMKDISFLPPVQKMKLGKTGVSQFYTPAMQADMIAGYTTVKGVGWGVMIPQPFEELTDKAEGVVLVAFGIALIGVIVAGLISWRLASYLVKPIEAVMRSADAARQGQFSFDLPHLGWTVPEELRRLVFSFNHMVQQINTKNMEVEKSAARLAEAQRIASLGNWEWDAASDKLWCSEEISNIFVRDPGMFIGTRAKVLDLIHPEDREAVKKAMDDTLTSGQRSALDYRIPMGDGSEKVIHMEMVAHSDFTAEGTPWLVGTIHDITAAKKYEERLIYQANYDELTGLPNRALFLDRLTHALLTARRMEGRVGLLFVDLDNFKEVNDTLGHINGDKLLKQASLRLQECVRGNDTVARLSGDEFTVIVENLLHERDVVVVAEKIVAAMAKPFGVDTYEVLIGASIGISLYPNDGDDTATMLGNADIAMFRAKDQGRNSYCFFTSSMNDQMMHNMKLGNDLHNALNREEFSVFYQPIVDIEANRIVAAEALVRWKHPKRGWLQPSDFISLAEERGFIGPLGEWVLETACREAVRWRNDLPIAPRISVNLSIRQPKLGLNRTRIAELLNKCGLDPRQLTLEITESLVMEDSADAIAWLESVRGLGIRFSIDDFGTGYSSLSYLKRLPVNTLKIDRSFVTDLTTDTDNASLVESIIALANSFGLGVVAEGVENRSQVEFLGQRGCHLLQGYHFSRPLPADEFFTLLKNWRNGIPEELIKERL